MLNKVGRFEVHLDGCIHLTCKEDEIELFNEISGMSKKNLRNLPLVTYDYEDSKSKKKGMI